MKTRLGWTDVAVIGIIPARAGSKGIPDKNLRTLGGLPLIAHTFREARRAASLDRIVLTTDSEAIARLGLEWGVSVPALRPPQLSGDDVPMVPVVCHALQMAEGEGVRADWVVLLQPTSPLRTARDIDSCVAVALRGGCDIVASVGEAEFNPFHCGVRLGANGRVVPLIESESSDAGEGLRQAVPDVYRLNGAVYVATREALVSYRSLSPIGAHPSLRCQPYIMPRERSIDIDAPLDLAFAEFILQRAEVCS